MKRTLMLAVAVIASASCSVDPASIPQPTGPSEFALSLALSATPDVISQNGVSTSTLSITARGPNGLALPGLSTRVDILVEGTGGQLVVADYGSVSNKWPTTGSDGKAVVIYQSPPQPPAGVTSDKTITLRVTPIGSNYSSSLARSVTVLLVRPGAILPPTRMVPRFTFSPSTPREYDAVNFDASSSSDPDAQIAAYAWDFGDGRAGTGKAVAHAYELAGSYSVVLTVSDSNGTRVASQPVTVAVTSSPGPTALFTMSPTAPRIGTPVVFNAAASVATTGRQIVGYDWDLGDGTFVSGVAPVHTYTSPGVYSVVLTVTDDAGRKGVKSATLSVSDAAVPTAAFTVSPTDPVVNDLVSFNAAASAAPGGRRIVRYDWNFGDGTTGEGVTISHPFGVARTYTVVLTVTDDAGGKGVVSRTVTVRTPFD